MMFTRPLDCRLIRPSSTKTEELPRELWHTCPVCQGSGSTYSEGDLHRSPGVIPCPNFYCRGGIVKFRSVIISKPVYRVRARRNK